MSAHSQSSDTSFIRGGDLSSTPQIEGAGGHFTQGGVQQDVLDIFRGNGANYVRLRIWHTPTNGICGLAQTLAFAQRIKTKGLKFLLDFHYSDYWADPGKQNKPAAWVGITFDALKDSVYVYTRDVVEALKNQGTLPDMVQIGNEITAGMLWPDGKLGGANPTQAWVQFAQLVQQGISGARDAAAGSPMFIMIHIDRGGDNATSRWFFDNLLGQGVQFDVIGQSYYPWWHGSLDALKTNLYDLAVRYGKPLVVAETAYPWTTQSVSDGVGNVGYNASTLPDGYPVTPQGQKAFLAKVISILKSVPNGKGAGFFYWEPAYISVPPVGSPWEPFATFDFNGETLTTITDFMNLDSIPRANVSLRFNTATNADTLKPGGVVQVRGEIKGIGSNVLPGGELLTWDALSEVYAANAGGDYWECNIKMFPEDRLEFKVWTGHTAALPTYLRLGWEGPVTPFDSSSVTVRAFVAGSRDTSLNVEYYNSAGTSVDQYWSPFTSDNDSIGVLFRVNLVDLMNAGTFNPAVHGPLTVRGDSATSGGRLSWSSDKLVLSRETTSVANGSFWSGIAYFPKATIAPGTPIPYKFFVRNSSFDGGENAIGDRMFTFPAGDTTLAWRFFNDRNPVTSVNGPLHNLPDKPELYQNYPNPFNPETSIGYIIPERTLVILTVSNVLGQVIRTLVDGVQEAGEHFVTWDGTTARGRFASSGVYFISLDGRGTHQVRKMLLVR